MKQRRMATGFLHTSAILPCSAVLNFLEFYIAAHAIEWQIGQNLLGPDTTNWDQVMDHFLK